MSSITGSIRDPAGAAVAKVMVTVTSTEQAFTHTAVTNASGDYLVSGLPAGTYNIGVKRRQLGRQLLWGANNSAGDPSCIASGNTFLTATGAHNPRILQLGMKLVF